MTYTKKGSAMTDIDDNWLDEIDVDFDDIPEDWEDEDALFLEELEEYEKRNLIESYAGKGKKIDYDYDYSVEDYPYGYEID